MTMSIFKLGKASKLLYVLVRIEKAFRIEQVFDVLHHVDGSLGLRIRNVGSFHDS